MTYIITFLFVDMAYYWFHRAAHGKLKKNMMMDEILMFYEYFF